MPLPKLTARTFTVTMPSTKKNVTCRVMQSREEKLLLIAKAGDADTDRLLAIRQVVNNCIIDTIDIDKLALFDLEWLFLRIRRESVGNVSKVWYRDNQDQKVREFDVDLDKVTVWWPETKEGEDPSLIKVNDKVMIKMKYPPASLYIDPAIMGEDSDKVVTTLIIRCVDKVFNGEEVTPADQATPDEMTEFLDSLDIPAYNNIREFIGSVPHLLYEIDYANDMGEQRKITLSTLNDFFIF